MSIIKKQILFKGETAYIDFNLKSKDNFLGYQQNIDSISNFESLAVVNDATDAEKRKFSFYSEGGSQTLRVYFLNPYGSHENSFTALGYFWSTEYITGGSAHVLNSFYILDFYDSPIISKQKKIFTTYLTKIVKSVTSYVPTYNIPVLMNNSNRTQLYYLYIPRSFINNQTQPIVTGYTKFSFFNAYDGTIKSFLNTGQTYGAAEEKMFLKTELDLTGRTWQFITTSNTINLHQLRGGEYDTRMSDTVNKENIDKPLYPSLKIFDYRTRNYTSE